MGKGLAMIGAAIVFVSAGSLLSNDAAAGGAQAKTLSSPTRSATLSRHRKTRTAQPSALGVSEFSSSSVPSKSKPNR
jgi:hypothetical protein